MIFHWGYHFVIVCVEFSIRIAAFFHTKAKLWIEGRRDWRKRYNSLFHKQKKVLWMHVSSLGEFEQGRPVLEAFRAAYPDWQVVLSFFSPSGYEIRKNYPYADFICYLPSDTPANARDFLDIVQPDCAIFVKYDFWANHLFELKKRRVPTLLIAALFRENQPFFRFYGGLWREMLRCFTHFFVQNEASQKLLQSIGFQNITVCGDTRADRVLRLVQEASDNQTAAVFSQSATRVLVAGSTWKPDEDLLINVLQHKAFSHYKIIMAPHDPSRASAVARAAAPLGSVLLYSEANARTEQGKKGIQAARVLLIDNVGMLNTLYRYGTLAYIGGGFGKGIHNTLEPAAWGLPVLFGPKHEWFEEARQMLRRGGAFALRQKDDLLHILQSLENEAFEQNAVQAIKNYLQESQGATERVMAYLGNVEC